MPHFSLRQELYMQINPQMFKRLKQEFHSKINFKLNSNLPKTSKQRWKITKFRMIHLNKQKLSAQLIAKISFSQISRPKLVKRRVIVMWQEIRPSIQILNSKTNYNNLRLEINSQRSNKVTQIQSKLLKKNWTPISNLPCLTN